MSNAAPGTDNLVCAPWNERDDNYVEIEYNPEDELQDDAIAQIEDSVMLNFK